MRGSGSEEATALGGGIGGLTARGAGRRRADPARLAATGMRSRPARGATPGVVGPRESTGPENRAPRPSRRKAPPEARDRRMGVANDPRPHGIRREDRALVAILIGAAPHPRGRSPGNPAPVRPGQSLQAPGDEPGASIVGEVGPRPSEQHDEAVPEPDQEEDVDEQPGHPGQPSRELDDVQVGDAGRAADRRERPLVAIAEREAGLVLQRAQDVRAACRASWMAAGATPGTSDPSCSKWARSPMT